MDVIIRGHQRELSSISVTFDFDSTTYMLTVELLPADT